MRWPWKKKPKQVNLDEILNKIQSSVMGKTGPVCSPILEASKLCSCIDCPKRGTCSIEKIHGAGECAHFVMACSLKSETLSSTKDAPSSFFKKAFTHPKEE